MRSIDTRITAWLSRAALAAAIVASLATGASAQGSGLQQTPDSARYLISKDVGAERWAITLNPTDGTVTGNVILSDGGAPKFVWCRRTGDDGKLDPAKVKIGLRCYGQSRCDAAPCGE